MDPLYIIQNGQTVDIRLNGRTALITGGSRGLGFAMARTFAAAGANVAIVARRADVLEDARAALAAQASVRVVASACDVRDAESLVEAHATIVAELGRIDILVNNAGTSARMP